MPNGQVVLVTTEPLDGGLPIRTVYYVAEEDPSKAEAIIAACMAPNEQVQAYGPLPEAAVKALGLKPGSSTHDQIPQTPDCRTVLNYRRAECLSMTATPFKPKPKPMPGDPPQPGPSDPPQPRPRPS